MGKTLVIAEKPSVGRDIAKVLGCRQKGEGSLEGDAYIVTWAIGHLVTLAEPEEYDPKYKKWSYETLPIIPESMQLKPASKTRKQFNVVKKLMTSREVDSVICATDAGREGELIFRYIYHLVGCRKPFRRLWLSSMTDTAIRDAFGRLKPGSEYDALYYSAKCRSEADWLVGMNASRAYTIQYDALLSIGRVQTPTLAILVDRQKEIDEFVPQDYWEVQGDFKDFKGIWVDKKTGNSRIDEQMKAETIAAKAKGQDGQVLKVEEEEKRQAPPLLYDLTELQRDGNRRFGFSAKKTLSIAQDLYEKRKMITYPRTDSRYLSQDIVPELKGILGKLNTGPYQPYAKQVLGLPKLPITKRIVNDSKVTDHHAIIPTEVSPRLDSLTGDERKIYDLIVRRFLAVFYPYYVYKITTVLLDVREEHFQAKGKSILDLGWMELYKEGMKKDEEEQSLPQMKEWDPVTAVDAQVLKKQTKPPNPYTEATLLSAMEHVGKLVEDEELMEQLKERGLGTPATRAAIIERLLQVGYIERRGKALFPTDKGIKLIEVVPHELRSPETTGKWEKGLSSIAKGAMLPETFMESIERYVRYLVEQSRKSDQQVVFPKEVKRGRRGQRAAAPRASKEPLGKCPVCGQGEIIANSKGYGCTRWKEGCKFFIGRICGKNITPTQAKKLITSGATGVIKGFKAKSGNTFDAALVLKDGKVEFGERNS